MINPAYKPDFTVVNLSNDVEELNKLYSNSIELVDALLSIHMLGPSNKAYEIADKALCKWFGEDYEGGK